LTVGDEVRTARLDRGLSQHEVCSMMSVSKGFVFEMEDKEDNSHTIFSLHKAYQFLGKIPETLKLDETTLQAKLSIHRIKNGYTLRQLQDKMRLDKSTIGRFEKGENVNDTTRNKIRAYIDFLYSLTDYTFK
jgi:transcriptional regulator with XRE-family HTH domain